jgi:ABC-type polar amino acid transport system ATPase subunit
MIQVENLTKYYGDLAAIKDVSFSVEKCDIVKLPTSFLCKWLLSARLSNL